MWTHFLSKAISIRYRLGNFYSTSTYHNLNSCLLCLFQAGSSPVSSISGFSVGSGRVDEAVDDFKVNIIKRNKVIKINTCVVSLAVLSAWGKTLVCPFSNRLKNISSCRTMTRSRAKMPLVLLKQVSDVCKF